MSRVIAILDDEIGNVERWSDWLRRIPTLEHTFEVRGDARFRKDVEELEHRRSSARSGDAARTTDTIFDAADVLIIDYDLIGVDSEHYLTGETVAYLARCYSRCGIIIVLNQSGENPFDLTLRGNPSSFADLNIGSSQIANGALWGIPHDGFRPWAWFDVSQALESYRRRVDHLAAGLLDTPIMEALRLPSAAVDSLPRTAREWLEGAEPPERLTFREFVKSPKFALRRKDALPDDYATARVAAARLTKWLEQVVLPEQDLLVDAPHVVSRYPSLIRGPTTDRESWDSIAIFGQDPRSSMNADVIQPFLFDNGVWLSRPVWLGQVIAAEAAMPEVQDPWSRTPVDLAFCEDLSRFLPRASTREFVADVESPYVRRFVADPDAMDQAEIAAQLRAVDYRPAVRFSL